MHAMPRTNLATQHIRRAITCSVLLLALSACAQTVSDPSASPSQGSPRESAASSIAASGEPSPLASATAGATSSPDAALATDTIGRVVVTDLVTRTAPGVGEDSTILELGLTDGDLVYVIEGPRPADGYDWLLVTQLTPEFASRAAGWIAPASREGEEWVQPATPDCPAEVSVEAFAPESPALLLKCFGGQELTLDGVYGSCAHGDPVIQEPAWLANYFCSFEVPGRPDGATDWPSIIVHTDPDAEVPAPDGAPQPVRITGRYDSPVAETCRFIDEAEEIMPELGEMDELFLRFNCRAAFVVESATPIEP
jgi:hypothetical protein